MKQKTKNVLYDTAAFAAGGILYAAAVNFFLVPSGILPGGFTGIAAAAARLSGVKKGALLLIMNIPVFYTWLRKSGGALLLKTAVVTALLSALLDLSELPRLVFSGDKMLAALAGGVLLGLGIGLIMLRGATTGGVDIIAKLINEKKPSLTVGRVILAGDIISIVLSGIVFGDISNVLYSLVAVYAAARVTDLVLYGAGGGKTVIAVTERGKQTAAAVLENAHRGVTVLSAFGGYTGKEKTVIYCVCRRDEINKVVYAIKTADPACFITVLDAGDVIGEGFKR